MRCLLFLLGYKPIALHLPNDRCPRKPMLVDIQPLRKPMHLFSMMIMIKNSLLNDDCVKKLVFSVLLRFLVMTIQRIPCPLPHP
jgi:hypothetical protein